MRGFFVDFQDGVDIDAAKKSLESAIGKGYIAFHEGSGHQETDIMVSEGMYAKVNVYHVSVDFPKPGLMAFIGTPAHIKLINFQGGYQIPESLKDKIASITPCDLEKKVIGRQG